MKRVIVGVSGATGTIYAKKVLEVFKGLGIETYLVISDGAERTMQLETDFNSDTLKSLASQVYDIKDLGANISSGSFINEGMVVVPCSIKSLSGIANSYNDNLLVRAADVTLKENRKLVLVVRETPLHQGHLKLMLAASEIGAVILPPMPAFYTRPVSIEDIINQTVGKIMDQFGIDSKLFRRWGNSCQGGIEDMEKRTVKIRGQIVSGRQEASSFVALEWVTRQCEQKLGFRPYQGTLNIAVEAQVAEKLKLEAEKNGIILASEAKGYCDAHCLKATVGGYAGALVFPAVSGYYNGIIEVIAPVKIKDTLGLSDNDRIEIDVLIDEMN